MSEELQQQLRNQLWNVANNLRGNMAANEFMYFSLGFIFYKYLSEKIEKFVDSALVDDDITFKALWQLNDEDAEELKTEVRNQCIENIGYFIEPEFLFSSVIDGINKKENILPLLERSLKQIEDSTLGQDSEEDFGGLFSDIDLASPKLGKTAEDKNALISNVLLALNEIKFGIEGAAEIDILGDAYEYMISQFAAGAGKKAGEFYMPQEVSQILADIVTTGKTRLRSVYDPTCGSGSLLIRAARNGNAEDIFGQEKNPTTYNLCRMNMLLHGIKFNNFSIENNDTLEKDEFADQQFDASKEFEKVKTQNKLREEHIKKIVETYRERKEIEKYSHLTTLDEVKENDFNLNIPRYVDTFEEEEGIDIKAVMQEIKDLEAKRADLDKEIEVYLRELGIVE
jgi:type I restriction enzyme M protein